MSGNSSLSSYDQWAEYYDLVEGDRSRSPMVAFYRNLAERAPCVLELGCGTGIVLDTVAKHIEAQRGALHGVRFTGVDGSAQMLKRARDRNPRLEWVLGDMRRPPIYGPYDLVFSCFNTLQFCESEKDLLQVFDAAREQLADGGTFAFDIYQPNIAFVSVRQRNRLVRRVIDARGRQLEVREDAFYDASSRIYTLDWRLEEPGVRRPPIARTSHRLRQYFASDIERLLAEAGLLIRERFGDFDRSAFTSESKKQVVVCRLR